MYEAAPLEPGIKTKDLKMALTLYRPKDHMWKFTRGIDTLNDMINSEKKEHKSVFSLPAP